MRPQSLFRHPSVPPKLSACLTEYRITSKRLILYLLLDQGKHWFVCVARTGALKRRKLS